ncbi:phosphoglycerate kinase [Candidatus Woesearchaeota archaeon]|nr:phosphoglycerate kinase [Candidatus Woesearchaeota archaeon]
MPFKTVKQLSVKGKKVLVRVDFNVPLSKGKVADATKIIAALPTLHYLDKQGASKIVCMSHLGKPEKELKKGKSREEVEAKFTLQPVAEKFQELLGKKVAFVADLQNIPDEKFVLLENTRFNEGEKSKDDDERKAFARELAATVGKEGVYVNDAFGTCHRKHASVYDITQFLPSAAGFLVEKEINALKPFVNPGKSSVAVLGGAKIEDKLDAVKALAEKYDSVLLGGGMTFTFFKAEGFEIGDSLLDEEKIGEAAEIMKKFGKKLILPSDIRVAKILNKEKKVNELGKNDYKDVKEVPSDEIPPGYTGLDIGRKTIENHKKIIAQAKTIFWNGAMGVFEISDFSKGTMAIAKAISDNKAATKIAGGGETVEVIHEGNLEIPTSTGGGASIDFLRKKLPAIEALERSR